MKTENLKRRGLSGMYIFDKFPEDEKRKPTCIEDCQKETREKYLKGQDEEFLINTIEILCETIRNMSDECGICVVRCDNEQDEDTIDERFGFTHNEMANLNNHF